MTKWTLIVFLLLADGTATPVWSAPVTNTMTMPFSGVFAGPDENIALTGNVLVKTVHTPGDPRKRISMSIKFDKSTSTAIGMTSGQPYAFKGPSGAKFKYVFPTASPVTQLAASIGIPICCNKLCLACDDFPFPIVKVTAILDSVTGQIMTGESGAGPVLPAPTAGSCSTIAEVCN